MFSGRGATNGVARVFDERGCLKIPLIMNAVQHVNWGKVSIRKIAKAKYHSKCALAWYLKKHSEDADVTLASDYKHNQAIRK